MQTPTSPLIIAAVGVVVLAAGVAASRPTPAVATEETPFTQLRQTLRTFQTLRFAGAYISPQAMAVAHADVEHTCALHEPRMDCVHGGVVTILGDGRISFDQEDSPWLRRILFEPPNIHRQYLGWVEAPPPDSPVAFIPYFEAAFAVLRSGFGDAPALTGTADEFGHYSDFGADMLWYRVPVVHPAFGEAEVFTMFNYAGELQEVDFVHATGLHRFLVGDAVLVNFELEPRWFDHNLVRLHLPMLSSTEANDTGDGLPDGRAKVIE